MTTASKVDRGLLHCFSIILPLGALKPCECWLSTYSMQCHHIIHQTTVDLGIPMFKTLGFNTRSGADSSWLISARLGTVSPACGAWGMCLSKSAQVPACYCLHFCSFHIGKKTVVLSTFLVNVPTVIQCNAVRSFKQSFFWSDYKLL